MKNAVRLFCLAAVLAVASRIPSAAVLSKSVCWVTCCNTTAPFNCKTIVSPPDYTKAQCCGGQVLECSAGQTPVSFAWGSPAQLCS